MYQAGHTPLLTLSHLIAGPILHHSEMMPQFSSSKTYHIHSNNLAAGLTIFVFGLVKKVLIADSLSSHANHFFNAASDGQILPFLDAWSGALAYTLQLYFDFSGYSDMAIGLSLMFNIRLPVNFDSPYKSTSIIDFWKRWHMTLSRFLRDYLYIPLGGNRKGEPRRYLNLMVTMLLGGFWHGAGWTYVIWGGIHGIFLIINHGWRDLKASMNWGEGGRFEKLCAGSLTFLSVVVAWVFFRADNITTACSIVTSMLGMNSFMDRWVPVREALKLVIPCLAIVWLMPNVRQMFIQYKPAYEDIAGISTPAVKADSENKNWFSWNLSLANAVIGGMFFFIILLYLGAQGLSEFLYFQF